MDAFEQLHPAVQQWVWRQGWPSLRPIQKKAIPVVLARESDVVITAPTAGGKTEAAYLPIISDLIDRPRDRLYCLAVAPLKALINDQTRRLEGLCEDLGLRIQPWHGDVSMDRGRFFKRPADILMITPESLEAILMRRAAAFAAICPDLRYLVVDELHAFPGSERGAQLLSLLSRVERLVGRPVPRIGLSATLGSPDAAIRYLRPAGELPGRLVEDEGHGAELRLQLRAVVQQSDGGDQPDDDSEPVLSQQQAQQLEAQKKVVLPPPPGEVDDEGRPVSAPAVSSGASLASDPYTTALEVIADHLFDRLRGDSHLVFANSRQRVEVLADLLREKSESMGLPNEFFAHHGSLSREFRLSVEDRLRDGSLPTTAVCTSTLELGIDIGDVVSIAQVGAPPSVSALKQRIGRSGRRKGQAQTLRGYVLLPALDAKSHLIDWLRLPLVQCMASIECMIAGEFEPAEPAELNLSTLTQQILSVIAQSGGGLKAASLYDTLCASGSFRNISPAMFADVLRSLGGQEVIEQVPGGDLLPGAAGERMIAHYSFYAAFATAEEYSLVHGAKVLGSLPVEEPLMPGQLLVFAGHRWRVEELDSRDKVIRVVPAPKGKPPNFGGGGIAVHRIVQERMRAILAAEAMPSYLDRVAQSELSGARSSFRSYGLDTTSIVETGHGTILAHWGGSQVGTSLGLLLQAGGLESEPEGPALVIEGADAGRVMGCLRELPTSRDGIEALALRHAQPLIEQKWDGLLSPELLKSSFMARHIDAAGVLDVVRRLINEGVGRRQ